MQGAVIFLMCEAAVIMGLSLMFVAGYFVYETYRVNKDYDTEEDDLGYLQYLNNEEVN